MINTFSVLILCILFIPQILSGFQSFNPPFNARQVIKRISHHPIKDNVYEPLFDETDEFLIDTNVVYFPAPDDQKSPAVAFDGTNYLVVWEDRRSGCSDIYCARVSRDGEVLDPQGIQISTALGDQKSPAVAFDGTNYLVVWEDTRSGSSDIYGARISRSGKVLEPEGITISNAPDYQGSPSVAFDGTNYLVVWEDRRSGYYDIYGARVSTIGEVLDPEGIAISTTPNKQCLPSVASDGTTYLVVWEEYRWVWWDIYGARVSRNGTVLDPEGIAISTDTNDQQSPSVAFDGTNYLVVWEDYRRGWWCDIYGARVSRNGTVLDPEGIAISTTTYDLGPPSVAFGGTNYLVVWQEHRSGWWDIYGARVSVNGEVLDPEGILILAAPASQSSLFITFGGTNYLVVWEDHRSGCDVYGARVSVNGEVLDPQGITISTATNSQFSPSVAFDGTNYLVVWEDHRSGCDVYGARVSRNGEVLDPQGITISTATNDQKFPSVAFDGTNYLVVWQDYRRGWEWDIYGARVSRNGEVLDPQGIPISTATNDQKSPSIAFNGVHYLVVWEDHRSECDVYGARVGANGKVLDPEGIAVSTAPNCQFSPSVAFDGTNYLVVWEDGRSGCDIYGARVSRGGTVLDPEGIAVSTATNSQFSPSVAFDGTNYLVVWEDTRNGYPDIYGARVSRDGGVLDPQGIAVSTATNSQHSPSVAFGGTNYLVVWEDRRSGSWDLYGVRVNPSGAVIESFPVSLQEGNQFSPALAHGQESQLLITYSGFVRFINNHPVNTMRILGKFYPFIGIEEDFSISHNRPQSLLIPNPFPSSARIRYRLNRPCDVLLKVYNISGQSVRTLVNKRQDAGGYEVEWDGKDRNGQKLSCGIYIFRLDADESTLTDKLLPHH